MPIDTRLHGNARNVRSSNALSSCSLMYAHRAQQPFGLRTGDSAFDQQGCKPLKRSLSDSENSRLGRLTHAVGGSRLGAQGPESFGGWTSARERLLAYFPASPCSTLRSTDCGCQSQRTHKRVRALALLFSGHITAAPNAQTPLCHGRLGVLVPTR